MLQQPELPTNLCHLARYFGNKLLDCGCNNKSCRKACCRAHTRVKLCALP
jgi:hypothetical protein